MPHVRHRHVTAELKKLMRFSPIVALFGHRQSGKTTLVETLSDRYFTFDLQTTVDVVASDPLAFLEENTKNGVLVLDECQMMPALFPALKEHVRRNKRPGQIVVTGSVRFSARKAISESLTGRFIGLELLPLSWNEIEKDQLSQSVPIALSAKNLEFPLGNKSRISNETIEKFFQRGTLPGFFALRDQSVIEQKFLTQLQTLLERDVKLIFPTTLSFESVRRLASELSRRQGLPIELSEISRSVRISVPTLKRLLIAFEAMFLVRRIPTLGGEKKEIIYFEDQGEANFLSRLSPDSPIAFELFVYQMLRCQWMYRPELRIQLSQWRTRNGAQIPFVLMGPKGKLAIIPVLEENPPPQAIGSAGSFLKAHPDAKVIYVHLGKKDFNLSANQRSVSIAKLL